MKEKRMKPNRLLDLKIKEQKEIMEERKRCERLLDKYLKKINYRPKQRENLDQNPRYELGKNTLLKKVISKSKIKRIKRGKALLQKRKKIQESLIKTEPTLEMKERVQKYTNGISLINNKKKTKVEKPDLDEIMEMALNK